jgi:hypothetical protein
MFQFPKFALLAYGFSQQWPLARPGSPIRAPPVRHFFASSPGLFAGTCALHRLLLPRHPPYALSFLPHSPKGLPPAMPLGTAGLPPRALWSFLLAARHLALQRCVALVLPCLARPPPFGHGHTTHGGRCWPLLNGQPRLSALLFYIRTLLC